MGECSHRLVTGDIDLRAALQVRRQVFVREQGISEDLVLGGCDSEALHMIVKDGERIIGSTRVPLVAANQAKLGRMAILKCYRRKGILREMLLFLDAV